MTFSWARKKKNNFMGPLFSDTSYTVHSNMDFCYKITHYDKVTMNENVELNNLLIKEKESSFVFVFFRKE